MPSYVVTGASRGIGLELVKQLSANTENKVFAIVRNKATAPRLRDLPRDNVTILEAGVTDAKALELAAAEVSKATENKLDYLINNAGSSTYSGVTLDQYPGPDALEKDLLDNFTNNTISVVHSTNGFLPLLKNGAAKKVLTVSSGLGDLELTLAGELATKPSYSISIRSSVQSGGLHLPRYQSGNRGLSATSASAPTAGALEELKMLSKAIPKLAPNFKGPITTEESVRMQLDVLNRRTVEETGAFVSHFGNKQNNGCRRKVITRLT